MKRTQQDLAQTFERTQLHRETYISALNGALSTRGAKQAYAAKVGISTQYLSYLLNPYDVRWPSNDVAHRLVEHAPIPAEERSELLHHLLMSNPHNHFIETSDMLPMSRVEAFDILTNIADAQFITFLKRSPEVAKQASRITLRLGSWAMMRINPRIFPFIYTEMAMHMHNTACALNMPISSYWYAASSLAVASDASLWHNNPHESERHNKIINSWRMLSVTFHNLGLADKALQAVDTAKHHLLATGTPDMIKQWIPHLVMEELNVYALTSRFPISAAEIAAEKGLNSLGFGFESRKMKDLLGSLIQRNLVEAYISHGSNKSLRLAERRVQEVFTPEHLQNFGSLNHTLHLRTGANLARKIGDIHSYQDWITRAHTLATDAGLIHQCAEIEQETQINLI